jgi:hypothetical protein
MPRHAAPLTARLEPAIIGPTVAGRELRDLHRGPPFTVIPDYLVALQPVYRTAGSDSHSAFR